MSRQSRGFTGRAVPPSVVPVCPSTISLQLTQVSANDWFYLAEWAPDVSIGTLTWYVQLNGGGWEIFSTSSNVTSGQELEIDPESIGLSGDTLSFYAAGTDMGACGDIQSPPVDSIIP